MRESRRGKNSNAALNCSLKTMRTTVHSSINETPFERHYGSKRGTEIHNYLNISPIEQNVASAKPEALQVFFHSPKEVENIISWS